MISEAEIQRVSEDQELEGTITQFKIKRTR